MEGHTMSEQNSVDLATHEGRIAQLQEAIRMCTMPSEIRAIVELAHGMSKERDGYESGFKKGYRFGEECGYRAGFQQQALNSQNSK